MYVQYFVVITNRHIGLKHDILFLLNISTGDAHSTQFFVTPKGVVVKSASKRHVILSNKSL